MINNPHCLSVGPKKTYYSVCKSVPLLFQPAELPILGVKRHDFIGYFSLISSRGQLKVNTASQELTKFVCKDE